jgi:hypothetical protein
VKVKVKMSTPRLIGLFERKKPSDETTSCRFSPVAICQVTVPPTTIVISYGEYALSLISTLPRVNTSAVGLGRDVTAADARVRFGGTVPVPTGPPVEPHAPVTMTQAQSAAA